MTRQEPHIVALLLSGGIGTRFSAMRPKQYIEVEGRPILQYTMEAFDRHPLITDLYVVCMPQWSAHVDHIAAHAHLTKYRQTLPSGATSYDSMRQGIEGLIALGLDDEAIVLVHDAVRPLVSPGIISDNIATCRAHGNAITVVYSNEAYMRVDGSNHGCGYASRDEYMRAQTPHTFTLRALRQLFAEAKEKGLTTSQSLFTLAGELGHHDLFIAQGDILNFKITKPQDLHIFQALKELL